MPPMMQPDNFVEQKPMFPQQQPDPSGQDEAQAPSPNPASMLSRSVPDLIDMEVIDMVMGDYNASKEWRRQWRILWDKEWQHMKGIYDTANKAQWQSKTFMPLTSKVVEIIVSNLHSAVFGPDMPVEWQTKRSDMDPQVRSTNELIQTDFDKCGAKAEFTDFLRNMCVMGTAVGEVGYAKETETVMIKQRQQPSPMDEMLKSMGLNSGEQFVPKQMLVKDYATIKNIDLYDIYPQPRKTDFSKDSWVIHKTKITNRELMIGSREQDPYYRLDNVTNDILEGSGSERVEQDPEKQTRRFALMDYNYTTHFMDPEREHDLYKFYGQIPLWFLQPELRKDPKRQYDSVPGVIWVVDGWKVVWKRLSPWRDGEPPFFKGNYIRIPTQFYGIGVAELVMGLQVEKNEIRNSRMDNINLSMNKIIAVIKDMIPAGEYKRLVSEPGALWMFKGVEKVADAFQIVEFGNVTQDSWVASKEVDQEAQEVTAASKVTQAAGGGEDEAGGGTFRGQMLNVQQATGRWMLYARMLEWTGLMVAIKKFYHRIYQFKTYQDATETLGPERAQNFQFIPPEDLEKIAKLVPLGVMTMENKGVKLAQMNQFATLWMTMPFFKQLEFSRKMWVEMGNPEPDAVLFSDDEMKQYNQMHQMLLAQAGQMGPIGMDGAAGPPQGGLLGPNDQPAPQSGQGGNVPGGMPVSGNVPGPSHQMPRPALPARGPGASQFDMHGGPMS